MQKEEKHTEYRGQILGSGEWAFWADSSAGTAMEIKDC
jgi:hypothetical protein